MFSQAFVKNSVGGVHGEGACVAGKTATAEYGMHPIGIHSCHPCDILKNPK